MKSLLVNFYRQLAICFWSHWLSCCVVYPLFTEHIISYSLTIVRAKYFYILQVLTVVVFRESATALGAKDGPIKATLASFKRQNFNFSVFGVWILCFKKELSLLISRKFPQLVCSPLKHRHSYTHWKKPSVRKVLSNAYSRHTVLGLKPLSHNALVNIGPLS